MGHVDVTTTHTSLWIREFYTDWFPYSTVDRRGQIYKKGKTIRSSKNYEQGQDVATMHMYNFKVIFPLFTTFTRSVTLLM